MQHISDGDYNMVKHNITILIYVVWKTSVK